jgi:Transposase DDE domain
MDIVQTVTTSLQQLLGAQLDDLARACGLVRRQRKFTGQTSLRMLVVTLLHKPDASCWDFLVTATQLGLQLTPTAVQKRCAAGQPLVDFLRQALERALQQVVASQPTAAALLQRFTAVFLGDSSTITLPDELADAFPGCGGTAGTSRAALKIQVLWDLKSGRLERLLVEAGRASDAHSPIALDQAEPGTLLVYDLGYFDVARFAALDRQQARFISRLQHGTTVYDADGVVLDLVAFLRRQPTGVVDVPIQLGAAARLCCRLIGVRVPAEVAARRRQQARDKARDHGREPSAAYLELLGWTLFVTNCAAEELSWRAVVVLYRARWQIELLFKLWKSHNGLTRARAGATALERLAVFYAKLLGVVLQHWLLLATAWLSQRRSLLRGARVLRDELKGLLLALDDAAALAAGLRRLQQLLQRLAQVQARKKDPSHAQLLDDPELLDWLT